MEGRSAERFGKAACKQLSQLLEGEHEQGVFVWDSTGQEEGLDKAELILIGRIWASRSINVKAAVDTMCKLWNRKGQVIGNVLNAKLRIFAFRFSDVRDKLRVVEGQPWHFDKFVWCFSEPNPKGKMTHLGDFASMDPLTDPEMQWAIRVRVLLDIRNPLKSYVAIQMQNAVNYFDVKYERLPIFCYGCEKLGHGEKDCDDGPYEEGEHLYEDWIRASPRKVERTIVEPSAGVQRSLSAVFEEEQRIREQVDVENMVERLLNIAITFKNMKATKVGDGDEEKEIMRKVRVRGVVIEEVEEVEGLGVTIHGHKLGGVGVGLENGNMKDKKGNNGVEIRMEDVIMGECNKKGGTDKKLARVKDKSGNHEGGTGVSVVGRMVGHVKRGREDDGLAIAGCVKKAHVLAEATQHEAVVEISQPRREL